MHGHYVTEELVAMKRVKKVLVLLVLLLGEWDFCWH